MKTRRKFLMTATAGAAGLVLPVWAQEAAADFPNKAVRYVVPFPAGGLTDVMARLVGQKVGETLGQPVVVENKPGANANLGAELVAKSSPDGYTWLAVTLAHAVNQSLFPKLSYSMTKNLVPVAHLANSPLVLVVPASSPLKNLQEFLDAARSRTLNAGSSGNGTPPHLGLELLMLNGKFKAQHVPYKGGAPSLNDLMGSQLDFIVSNLPEASAYVKGQKLRALAITSVQRHELLPEVPTFAEAGLSGMELENWTGLMMPAGTPPAIVKKVAASAMREIRQPALKERLLSMGFTPTGLESAEFEAILTRDIARWNQIIKERGISAV